MLQSRHRQLGLIRRLARIPPIHGRNHAEDRPLAPANQANPHSSTRKSHSLPIRNLQQGVEPGRSERNDYTYLRGMIGVSDSENGETPIFLRKRRRRHPTEHLGRNRRHLREQTDGGLLSCGKFLYLNAGDGQDGLRRRYITWNRTIDPRLMR